MKRINFSSVKFIMQVCKIIEMNVVDKIPTGVLMFGIHL